MLMSQLAKDHLGWLIQPALRMLLVLVCLEAQLLQSSCNLLSSGLLPFLWVWHLMVQGSVRCFPLYAFEIFDCNRRKNSIDWERDGIQPRRM